MQGVFFEIIILYLSFLIILYIEPLCALKLWNIIFNIEEKRINNRAIFKETERLD